MVRFVAEADSGAVPPISAAIRDARQQAGLSQEQLGALVQRSQSVITKWENHQEPRLDELAHVEQVLELPAGFLLRAAGYVDEADTTEERIASDSALPRAARRALVEAYRSLVKEA